MNASAARLSSVPELMTKPQVAELLQVWPRTVDALVRKGVLPRIKLSGGTVRFWRDDVLRMLESA